MDCEFPSILFPSLYNSEPPDTGLRHCAGSWGSYGHLRPINPQISSLAYSFKPQHEVQGEAWCQTEPVPLPLQPPKNALPWPLKPPNPLDFSKHLQNFYLDHSSDAFSAAANILGEMLYFRRGPYENAQKPQDSINMWKVTNFMDELKYKKCPRIHTSACMDAYSCLLSDSVHSVPVELLGSLLHEELSLQSQHTLLCEANTGGALDFIPFTNSAGDTPQSGCLVYCANGVDQLHFQRVELQPHAVVCSNEAFSFLLKGPILQINSSSSCGHSCVAVRSLYRCGVWSITSTQQPRLLQAMSSTEKSTCISVSPHVPGEVLVASESGAAYLWTLGRGMQQIRTEDSNLYFNAQSSWRWCEFSAHPRVMLYADRTGVELTDIRVQPFSCHTLFRISQAAECRSGERLLTCRYLSGVHSFHHLISTQYSAYIMDERFPCVPMLKFDHMMEVPPVFCHVLPGSGLSCGTTKILLGSQRSQEVTLLQYSGGGAEACVRHGPPKALLRPRDSLQLLPAQIPHRTEVSRDRLACPATGLTSVQLKRNASGERFCVFQLLESGDIFYQILEKDTPPAQPSRAEGTRAAMESPEREQRAHVHPETALLMSSQVELKLSQESLSVWKQWLQKLVKKSHDVNKNKPGNVTVKSQFQMSKSKMKDSARSRRLQQDLKKSILKWSSSVGCMEEIVPLMDHVHAETWTDDLSRRLNSSWDSEAAWHAWWAEHLGANKAEKMAALRRKRRKEKEARRASGKSLMSLSGSFTSSISYQSELSDLSDSTGWVWSDTGRAASQPEDPPTETFEEHRLISLTMGTERSPVKPRPLVETPTSEWRAQHLQSQATLSLESPSIPLSVTHKPVDSSQDAFSWSQTSFQSALGRVSQTSQPKKKSRMGF